MQELRPQGSRHTFHLFLYNIRCSRVVELAYRLGSEIALQVDISSKA